MQGYIHKKDVLGLPEEEPEADEAGEAVEIPKKVTIFSSRRTVMTRGETVELTSLLEGFEDCSEILYQWECDNGSGFDPDATDLNGKPSGIRNIRELMELTGSGALEVQSVAGNGTTALLRVSKKRAAAKLS